MLLIQISITSEAYTRVTSGANSVTHMRRKEDPTHSCNQIVVAASVILLPTTRVTDSSNKLPVPCCSSSDESASWIGESKITYAYSCKRSSLGCVCCPIFPLITCNEAFKPSREATPGRKFVRLNCTLFYARKFGQIELI